MALLAEEIVQEWLNRQGYFTIRGIRLGNYEIDIVAIKFARENKEVKCRHIEVQASMRPAKYFTPLSKQVQKTTGRTANSATKRTAEELEDCVREWVEKKYRRPALLKLLNNLWDGPWTSELILNVVRHAEEANLIERHDVKITWLEKILMDLKQDKEYLIKGASGAALVDLIQWERPPSPAVS